MAHSGNQSPLHSPRPPYGDPFADRPGSHQPSPQTRFAELPVPQRYPSTGAGSAYGSAVTLQDPGPQPVPGYENDEENQPLTYGQPGSYYPPGG